MAARRKWLFKDESQDVHNKVYRAKLKGQTAKAIAIDLNLPISTVYRLMRKEPKYEL